MERSTFTLVCRAIVLTLSSERIVVEMCQYAKMFAPTGSCIGNPTGSCIGNPFSSQSQTIAFLAMDKYEITINTWNSVAQAYHDKMVNTDLYHHTYDLFCDLIHAKRAEILDVACGPGIVAKYLLNKRPDFKILGTDASPNMIKLAAAENPTATFEVLDCREIDRMGKEFDAIMCCFCLPYLSDEDSAQMIATASELLRPDGVIYISLIEDDPGKSGFQTSSAHDGQIYVQYHRGASVRATLEENGFRVLREIRQRDSQRDDSSSTDLFILAKKVDWSSIQEEL